MAGTKILLGPLYQRTGPRNFTHWLHLVGLGFAAAKRIGFSTVVAESWGKTNSASAGERGDENAELRSTE